MFLSKDAVLTLNMATATNATGRLSGDIVDMKDFESVTFLASYPTTNAGTESYLAHQVGSATDAMGDATGEVRLSKAGLYLEVHRPVKRYVRGVFISTASGKSKQLWTIQHGARVKPQEQPASTTGTILYSPSTGDATG